MRGSRKPKERWQVREYNMDRILRLESRNVTFRHISREEARQILDSRFSLHQLEDYFPLFEQYRRPDMAGKFVNLDFSQLYHLACIEQELLPILMQMCIGIEGALRLWLVNRLEKTADAEAFLQAYYASDQTYLDQIYAPERIDALEELTEGSLFLTRDIWTVLKAIHFGTLIKMIQFLHHTYTGKAHSTDLLPYLKQLDAVRKIRNTVAHGNSVLAKLPVKADDAADCALRAKIGLLGIKNRALTTNLQKSVVQELCGLLWVYARMVPEHQAVLARLGHFDQEICDRYSSFFSTNSMLMSVYTFLKSVAVALLGGRGEKI